MKKKYLGYQERDLETPFAVFYNEEIAPLTITIKNALQNAPLPKLALPPFSEASSLHNKGYQEHEIGYTEEAENAIHVAVLTPMPDVTPQMWDWWFGWHGCQDSRYKLWHPKAHIRAIWEDRKNDIAYIGRNSIIQEYIGTELFDAAIQFKDPTEFGFPPEVLENPHEVVYICARLGHPTLPVDYGYLVHQVRAVEGGSEMRSRFWVGGQYIQVRKQGILADFASEFIRKIHNLPAHFASDLLQHCAEEMTHLAAFLPDLYAQFHLQKTDLQIEGTITDRADPDFHDKVLATLFNKIDPQQRPYLMLEPKTVQDVVAALKYAKAKGKKVTICSGGHSFSANHVREDSILLVMKHFNEYQVHAAEMTATAGPGVGGSVLMKALYKQNLFFPAGHCKGVCIGGYLLQGGYGWNGRKTGIACESVIGVDVVTADGDLVHANATEHPDLFWAARGSGAGFFGVVVRFHLKLYPLPKYRAIMVHDFYIKYLEDVYRWAYEVGPSIPKAVEFQMMMSNKMLNILGAGIEAIAPIFADTQDEYEEAMAFMKNSPIKHKAVIATPAFNPSIDMLYKSVMSHYPENHYWGVDNMWTHAPIDDLLPFIHEIARTMPPAPSHFLWLNWHPGNIMTDMAYSNEDDTYLALYANWKNTADTAKYGDWAANMMRNMAHLSTGIQLADEGLHKRTAAFLSNQNLKRLQEIRAIYDPNALFHEWHSRPMVA